MTLEPRTHFDWANLAFGSKKPVSELNAIFIAAPREISPARFRQLVEKYLPQGNLVLGLAKEDFIAGFEDQPQFKTLRAQIVDPLIAKINASGAKHKIYTLSYFQRELPFVVDKIAFQRVLLINGSWKHMFHTQPAYYILVAKRIPYDMISPFTDTAEAQTYEDKTRAEIDQKVGHIDRGRTNYTEAELLKVAENHATRSYDYSFQTGTALARRISPTSDHYKILIATYNKVVPYETYALHHGSTREKNFSPPGDLNHYDAVHAEVWLLLRAQESAEDGHPQDLRGTTLFINLMPCPSCARMLSQTSIDEFVYTLDHSDGYAIKMLEAAGKKVRRLVP